VSNLPRALQTFQEPFEFQIFVDKNKGNWKMPFEWHDSLEIFYALSGQGRMFIGDNVYHFQKGDTFVIGSKELHKSQIKDGEPFEALIVMFHPSIIHMLKTDDITDEPLTIFNLRPPGFTHKVKVNREDQSFMECLFMQLQKEYEDSQEDSIRSIASLLNLLIILLKRKHTQKKKISPLYEKYSFQLNVLVSKALDHINEHYHEEIKLAKLANQLSVNPSYLSREFKRVTGVTLTEFITSKRVRHAKKALSNTLLMVTEIAGEVGYNNVTHFNWIFKKEVGMSPGEYRKYSKKIE